jgi:hypothetical protein
MKQVDILTKELIFGSLQEFPIRVVKMSKANGENCQISFISELDCFIICSKNVSMLCRSEKDIG